MAVRDETERGASAVEYGLLIASVAALIAAVVFTLGRVSAHQMSDSCDAVGGQIQHSLNDAGLDNGADPDCDND